MVGSTKICIKFFKIYDGGQSKLVFGGFETWLKFIKFGHWSALRWNLKNLSRGLNPPKPGLN